MKIIEFILSKIHYLIILNIGLTVFENMELHQKKMDEIVSLRGTIEDNILKTKKKIKKARAYEKNLEASRNRVIEVEKAITKVQRQLPNEINDAKIMAYFSDESKQLKIKDVFLTPLEETQEEFYYKKAFQLKGIGTYLQSLIFFERLNDNDRIFNLKEINIEKLDQKKKGRFQMVKLDLTLETFRYNPDYKVQVNENGVEKKDDK